MVDPRARPLQLITGKGGVGKSTLVTALALAWAERGRRPLVVELGHRASIEGVIRGAPAVGWDPVEVAPGVHAANIEGPRAVLEVVARWLRVRRLAERALRSEALQAFVGAAPGVVEVATIERILALLELGSGGWDPVLVDADASGHALMFLGLPAVFEELGVGGPVAALLDRTRRVFADPGRSALHLVTLPGALPVQETIELDARLRADGHVALGAVFVSRAPDAARLSLARIDALRSHAEAAGQGALAGDLALLARDVELGEEGRARIDVLSRAVDRAITLLPTLDVARPDHDALLALGRRALEGVA